MSPFASLLVPLDGSATAARSLGVATYLASRLGARLHVLSATPGERPAGEELRRLHVADAYHPLVELHQDPACPADAILDAIARYDARLVVMTARGAAPEDEAEAGAPEQPVGHVTRAVIERSAVPVLILPAAYQERVPWERVLVPMSGGTECDQALALAVRLAGALDLAVHVAHVVAAGAVAGAAADEELSARVRYADELHHEYAAQLEELVARAVPELGPEERRRIQDLALGRGDVADELVRLVRRDRVSALVVGWRGEFAAGRAEVLKRLLRVLDTPVLLVKCGAPAPFRLKIGDELE